MGHWRNLSLENLFEIHEGELIIEEWKPIVGYEYYYAVSSFGRFKSLIEGTRNCKIRILKQAHKRNGYLYVTLHKSLKQITHRAHRLVIQAFLENIHNKPYVNHLDSCRSNNKINNLEWTTAKENSGHAKSKGRLKGSKSMLGKKGRQNKKSKLVGQYTIDDKLIKKYHGTLEAARETKIQAVNIGKVCRNERVSAGGYKWKYE